MKGFLISIILLVILSGGGYFAFQYFSRPASMAPSPYKTEAVKLAGVLQVGKGDDYSHTLLSGGKFTGVASYSVNLDDYVGQKIEVTGQYSGTTFYADSVIKID